MVPHFTGHTYGGNQAFRFVKGIWFHRKSRQIRIFWKRPVLHYTCATCVELPSYKVLWSLTPTITTKCHAYFSTFCVLLLANSNKGLIVSVCRLSPKRIDL